MSAPISALGTEGQPHHHPNPVPLPAKEKSGPLWDNSKRQCGSQAAGGGCAWGASRCTGRRSVLSTAVQRSPGALPLRKEPELQLRGRPPRPSSFTCVPSWQPELHQERTAFQAGPLPLAFVPNLLSFPPLDNSISSQGVSLRGKGSHAQMAWEMS